ncbi:hypothetical protein CP533_5128 [Ophiocordyceps camponoti-saundersi (nom. inval.)]|nr:hypothetical protein CP533_5128 [Ophiocordyceps camponoti-saundersi (nom. inval.)]
MTYLVDARRWLHRKQYQFEVTFGVYMHTAWEKFAIYSVVFLLFGLAFIAAILYLPHHIFRLAGRAWYYLQGDDDLTMSSNPVLLSARDHLVDREL